MDLELGVIKLQVKSIYIVRKYWELAGGPRLIMLEVCPTQQAGGFVDPHTGKYMRSLESFPCTETNMALLTTHLFYMASLSAQSSMFPPTFTLRHFKLPPLFTTYTPEGSSLYKEIVSMWCRAEITLGRSTIYKA